MDNSRFISYSANFEDVILNRIFHRQPKGFFVDVGAAHPIFENDTKALSKRGWSGINIDPQPDFFAALKEDRLNDLNLQMAISEIDGECEFYEIVGTGLSTCDYEQARRSANSGREIKEYKVPTAPLASILERASAPSQIDLLKVDVEGFEAKVLLGNDWRRFRPKVILIESTFPETSVRRNATVTIILESVGYRFAYFDGLNDFFIDQNYHVADDLFSLPPNIFDNFVSYELFSLRQHRAQLADQVAELTDSIAKATQYAATLEQARASAERHAQALERSLASERSNTARRHDAE